MIFVAPSWGHVIAKSNLIKEYRQVHDIVLVAKGSV
jgi:hypothetical protein